MLGVYIHIPFCKKICNYCDFCKIYYACGNVSKYLDSLELEIKSRYKDEYVDTIYIGGGTPSCLSISELERLFDIVKIFKLKDKYEFTIECNIESIDEDKLKLFKDNGVNRISFGVESFDKDILKILGRYHDEEMVFKNIELSKKYFNNINIDLIYGVNSDIEIVKNDIEKFLKLDISHISCYSLILEENTKLYIDRHEYIDEDIDYEMFKYINDILVKNGYKHYEISNYAKEGYESKHNLTYWNNEEYYGFGVGAHGYINSMRYENTRSLNKYIKGNYRLEELLVSNQEEMENEIILGLRKLKGISVSEFEKKYQRSIFEAFNLEKAILKSYLVQKGDYLYIPEDKIYIMNEIINMIM